MISVREIDGAVNDFLKELRVSEVRTAEGRYPSRIVLRQVKPHTFATHIEVLPPNREPFFILGHYFTKREEAEVDFHQRVAELEGP